MTISILFLVLVFNLTLVEANYCVCKDLISEQVCSNPTTYDGICEWRDGACFELSCPERKSLTSCEPEYGYYWCGWTQDSKCINPTQCSDLAVKQWCLRSGCSWIPGIGDQQDAFTSSGACSGTLGQTHCENLDPSSCRNVDYFFDYNNYQYELCYVNHNGLCKSYSSCSLYEAEQNCDPTHCIWNKQSQQCSIKECQDMITQEECLLSGGDDQTAFMCYWDSSLCKPLSCSKITQQSQCNHQVEGYGDFCYWDNTKSSCSEYSCTDQTDKSVCLHHTFMEGGISTCTWATNPKTNQEECYGCDNGPSYTNFGVRLSQVGLIYVILTYIYMV